MDGRRVRWGKFKEDFTRSNESGGKQSERVFVLNEGDREREREVYWTRQQNQLQRIARWSHAWAALRRCWRQRMKH